MQNHLWIVTIADRITVSIFLTAPLLQVHHNQLSQVELQFQFLLLHLGIYVNIRQWVVINYCRQNYSLDFYC